LRSDSRAAVATVVDWSGSVEGITGLRVDD
jgi:hypothetical protein